MRNNGQRAPQHLQAATRKWYASVCDGYELEEHHARILQTACEAWDRMQGAREDLAKLGTTYLDRFSAPHARPQVAIERDARRDFHRAIRELALDVEPPASARPPIIHGRATQRIS